MHKALLFAALLCAATSTLHAVPCPITHAPPPSEADEALAHGKFEDAQRLYAAMPASEAATAGIVRAELGQRKFDDALALIQKELQTHPQDGFLLDVLGEVRYRRGEVDEAAKAYQQAGSVAPCLARVHYDISRYMNLNGLYASAQKQLDLAHQLSPDDPVISRVWNNSQRLPLTPEEQIANLRRRADDPANTPEQKQNIENAIKAVQMREKGDCELVQPVASGKIPLYSEFPGQNANRAPIGAGVDIFFNGKRRRFRVDTGASGILLSADAAKALGLTPEAETRTFGFGDSGPTGTYLAHVDDVKIGDFEFHNCVVRVLESKESWRANDGLLGPDTFRSFVVTLDFPALQMRLSPLPKRPDEAQAAPSLGTGGESGETSAPGKTIAELKRDRYVAPEMADWFRIFRSGHDLIFPTSIGDAPKKLFIMDTGSTGCLISPDAAREVTHVAKDSDRHVSGLNGQVKNVFSTDNLTITFANIRQQQNFGLSSIDLSRQSGGAGVEISGFLGYSLLKELVISIDYRDNLVHLAYAPHIEPGRH
jgi:hypothetical protein